MEFVGSLLRNSLRDLDMIIVCPCFGWFDVSNSFYAQEMELVITTILSIPSKDVA